MHLLVMQRKTLYEKRFGCCYSLAFLFLFPYDIIEAFIGFRKGNIMMKIKKFATYAAIGLLATSFVGCSREDSLDGEKVDFSQVENMSFSDNQAISTTLEEKLGISISEEAAEFLDADSVLKAVQGDSMNQAEYQQLVDNSYMYFLNV